MSFNLMWHSFYVVFFRLATGVYGLQLQDNLEVSGITDQGINGGDGPNTSVPILKDQLQIMTDTQKKDKYDFIKSDVTK